MRGVWAHVRPCGSVVQPSAGASTDGSDEGSRGGCRGARALDICAVCSRNQRVYNFDLLPITIKVL